MLPYVQSSLGTDPTPGPEKWPQRNNPEWVNPDLAKPEKQLVDAEYVRNWARKRGFDVGVRGHLSKSLVKYFNERHHGKYFRSTNPWEKQ